MIKSLQSIAFFLLCQIGLGQASEGFPEISQARPAVHPPHRDAHVFQPVHDSRIVAVHKTIDGQQRTYLAYDSDPRGFEIRLYYTNNLDSAWTPYSQNPVLGGKLTRLPSLLNRFLNLFGGRKARRKKRQQFRWPSTVWDGQTLHMFLANNAEHRLERWQSQDGINFTMQETILVPKGTEYMNPYCWKNPNDAKWYLYHKQHGSPRSLFVRSHEKLTQLRFVPPKKVLADDEVASGSVAAASVAYFKGRYWMMSEAKVAGIWATYAMTSLRPDTLFQMVQDSPVLCNDEAVPIPLQSPDGAKIYLYISRRTAAREWVAEVREIR